MKRIIYILVLSLIICNCSKDDIESTKDVDEIIGVWGNYQDIEIDTQYVWEYDPYNIENQIKFKKGGTLNTLFESETSYVEGTWENLNNGTYKMVYLGITEIIDIDFLGKNEMIFRLGDEDYYWIRINN